MKKATCPIDQQVQALEEAIRLKKAEMQKATASESQNLPPVISSVFSEISAKAAGAFQPLHQALEQGGGFARDFIENMQHKVRENPWQVLQQVAVYSFGVGLFLSRRHKKPSAEDRA